MCTQQGIQKPFSTHQDTLILQHVHHGIGYSETLQYNQTWVLNNPFNKIKSGYPKPFSTQQSTLVLILIVHTNFSEFSDDWHNR